MNSKKLISVVIPCYNEEENVRPICDAIRSEIINNCSDYDYEIIFIDNKSSDHTRYELRQMCAQDKKVKAIFNARNYGQNNSPYYGILQTTGDCTILMAADFQDPVEMIHLFVAEWENGCSVVIGHKINSKEGKLIHVLRTCYYRLLHVFSDINPIDHFTGFGLYDRAFICHMRDLKESRPFLRGMVAELAPEYKAIDFSQPIRKYGHTHNNFFSLYHIAMLSFTNYTSEGMRLATFFGFVVAFFSFIIGIFFFIAKLVSWDYFASGYAPIVIALFFLGGVQLVFLGFLGEYVMAINTRLMNRPLVMEEARINFDSTDPCSEKASKIENEN